MGRYDKRCRLEAIEPGTYRLTKMIELETGDAIRLPLTVTFSVAPGAEDSSVREVVTGFMRARLKGAGAEVLLDAHGRREFGAGGDTTPLYPDPPPQDYRIEFIDDLGNGSYEVGVSLFFADGTYGETLFVRERSGRITISGARPGLEGP